MSAFDEIFLADGLGGKGYLLFSGPLSKWRPQWSRQSMREGGLVESRVIAQLHDEMDENLGGHGRFASRVRRLTMHLGR